MSTEIDLVVTAIRKAGGKLRPSDLMKYFPRHDKRAVQRAVQSALDKGVVKLDGDMRLVVGQVEKAYQAA